MKIEIINKEEIKNLFKNHGDFACVCYDTPDKFSEKVGKSCFKSGHTSGSRCEYIKFKITDVDRGTCEQILRHEVGVKVPIEYQDNYYFGDVVDINPSNIVKTWQVLDILIKMASRIQYLKILKNVKKQRMSIKIL